MSWRPTRATIRIAQIGLAVALAFTAFAAYENGPRTLTLATQSIAGSYSAPVVREWGPWAPGESFTDADAGVVLAAAPVAVLTTRHGVAGATADAGAWTATLRFEKGNGAGRTWWVVEEPLPLEVEGESAVVRLDLNGTIARAREIDAQTTALGPLAISVKVAWRGNVVVEGVESVRERAATYALQPHDEYVTFTVTGDSERFTRTEEAGLPVLPIVLAAALIGLEGFIMTERRDPLDGPRGVRVANVRKLAVPKGTPKVELDDAIAIARDTGGVVLADRERMRVLVSGDVSVTADLPRPEHRPGPLAWIADLFRPGVRADGADAKDAEPDVEEDGEAVRAPSPAAGIARARPGAPPPEADEMDRFLAGLEVEERGSRRPRR